MRKVLALSDAVAVGLLSLAGTVIVTLGGVIVAMVTKESRRQNRQTEESVTDFEIAWRERGDLIEGYRKDHRALTARIAVVEVREQNCLDALELQTNRIAVLEARLGITPHE